MPHIPRRTSPTLGVPQEFQKPPAQAHPPLPKSKEVDSPAKRRTSLGVPKMSLHDYKVDEMQVLKTMFGKEPDVDPYTGQLVLTPTNKPLAPPNGQ
ncbi:MAG: hypothetical protein BWY85_02380 [Firmicutes bacterium ADurb.Bin506]|nr:MAG: hypothetical protein BWY85_02380 [Firmicutes bacterium ADurb.Bin506]